MVTIDPAIAMPINAAPTASPAGAAAEPAATQEPSDYTPGGSHAHVSDQLYDILRSASGDHTRAQAHAPNHTHAFSASRLVSASYAQNFLKTRKAHMNDLVKSKIWSSKKIQIYSHQMARRFKATAEASHGVRQAAGAAASSPGCFMSSMRHLDMEADGFHDTMKSMLGEMTTMNHQDQDLMRAGVDVPSDVVSIVDNERAAGNGAQIEQPMTDGDVEDAQNLVPDGDDAHLGEIPTDDMDWGKASFGWAQGSVQDGLNVFRDAVTAMEQGVNVSRKLQDPKAYGQWKDAPVHHTPLHASSGGAHAGAAAAAPGRGPQPDNPQQPDNHDEPQAVDGINAEGAAISLRRLKAESIELQEMADSVNSGG